MCARTKHLAKGEFGVLLHDAGAGSDREEHEGTLTALGLVPLGNLLAGSLLGLLGVLLSRHLLLALLRLFELDLEHRGRLLRSFGTAGHAAANTQRTVEHQQERDEGGGKSFCFGDGEGVVVLHVWFEGAGDVDGWRVLKAEGRA